jgi:hypothetical protein
LDKTRTPNPLWKNRVSLAILVLTEAVVIVVILPAHSVSSSLSTFLVGSIINMPLSNGGSLHLREHLAEEDRRSSPLVNPTERVDFVMLSSQTFF